MRKIGRDERGIAHVLLIIVIVIVLAAVAGVGWYVFKKQKSGSGSSVATKVSQKIAEANCKYPDKDICRFISSWKDSEFYTINSTDISDGVTSTSVFQIIGDDKFRMSSTGDTPFDMISIGNTTYTKDFETGIWWKQTTESTNDEGLKDIGLDIDFEDVSDDSSDLENSVYKKNGTEACGNLTCLKYQVKDDTLEAGATQYIWFDNKDYQLRRLEITDSTGSNNMVFLYTPFEINPPASYKELGPNQMYIPGQTEPVDLSL